MGEARPTLRGLVTLALLRNGPSYGLQIVDFVRAHGRWWHRASCALLSIYPLLNRMEDDGIIVSALEPRPNYPRYPRRLYRLRGPAGRSA